MLSKLLTKVLCRSLQMTVMLISLFVLLTASMQARAEGSWQMGLFEGLSFRQPLFETNANSNRSILRVDILSPGEVINVLVCGINNNNNVRVLMYDPAGTLVYNTTDTANVDCNDPFTSTFDPAVVDAHQYVTTTTGAYEVHLTNFNGNRLERFDVTVTNNVNEVIDPRAAGGRLWSDFWYFWAGSFGQERSTDADLFVVADGGFVGTYFIWKLDLNNFAGFGYGLKANSLGVNSPNAAGDTVAGLSVPSAGNSITEQYPIYLNYPALDFPLPTESFSVTDLVFLDDQQIDSAITAGGDGAFHFSTDYSSTAVYEIIIDISSPGGGGPDGVFGQGDVFLRGTAFPGDNVVPWDGRDNNGNNVALGAYQAELSVRTGEFHFTADDVETSGGPGSVGLKMFRVDPDGSESPTTLYWDDATVLNSNAPDAFNQIGIFDGDHNWGAFNAGGVGNVALIDTYTFGISVTPDPVAVAIVPDDSPLTTLEKSFTPQTISHAGISTMQFEITNSGTTTLTGVTVSDSMPDGMTLFSDPAAITVTGAGCSGFAFSADTVVGGNQLNIVDGTMQGGSVCVVSAEVTATLPGSLPNSTSAVTSNELPFGVGSNVANLFVEPDSSGTPFACGADFYEVETIAGTSRLFQVDAGVLPFTRSEFSGLGYVPSSDFNFSGLAYHPQQNYLYGIVNQSGTTPGAPATGSIVRIDADGKVVNLGVPEPGPGGIAMPIVSDQFVGATFSADGRYFVVTDSSAVSSTGQNIPVGERSLILEIDVSVNPPQVLRNRSHSRNIGDIVAHPDGRLYSHTSAEGLITIDGETGNVTVIGGNVSQPLSSLMADNWGQLYGHTESTGALIRIDALTGDGTVLSQLVGGITTDGASCAYGVSVRKTVSVAQVDSGSNATYALSVVNAGSTAATFDLIDNLQDSRTFISGSLTNPLGGSVNSYGDSNLLSISGMTLAANSESVLGFEVFFPPGLPEGTSTNQASLLYNGHQVLSDYPDTPVIGDATPIEVLAAPSIGVGKRAVVSGNEITYWFTVENTGFADLQMLSLPDNLDAVFGSGNFTVVVPPVLVDDPGTVAINPAFTGAAANADLFDAANSSLAAGQQVMIRVTVSVDTHSDTGAGPGVYSNQVQVTSRSENNVLVSDLSVDGDNVDPNGDGTPDEQSPTVVNLTTAYIVSGTVFEDNGKSAVAHDGVRAGAEPSIAGVVVELRDSAGNVLGTTNTDGSGFYSLSIAPSLSVSVLQVATPNATGLLSVSEAYVANGNANVADGVVQFITDQNTLDTQIDFGKVKTPQWLSDNVAENSPDTVVFHPHIYRAPSSGTLQIDYSSTTAFPAGADFSAALYVDSNCNGVIDGADSAMPVALSVVADQQVCVINKVYIPASAANDNTYHTAIAATLQFSEPPGVVHGVLDTQIRTDITRSVAAGQGVLVLDKTVENVTMAGVVTRSNTAAPGDVLRYNIDFRNSGTGPVTKVLIADSTPAFSTLEFPVQCPPVMPDGISGCEVLQPAPSENSVGYTGPIQWRFNGALTSGARSSLSFQIRVE